MPGVPVNLAVTTLVCLLHFAHEAAGAAGTRHSPRPLFRGEGFIETSGALRSEIADARLAVGGDLGGPLRSHIIMLAPQTAY
jgi:hypothetical protein